MKKTDMDDEVLLKKTSMKKRLDKLFIIIVVIVSIALLFKNTEIEKSRDGGIYISNLPGKSYDFCLHLDHAEFCGFNSVSQSISKIPDRIFGLPVTEITRITNVYSKYGFRLCSETVVIGKNVEIIGDSAFFMSIIKKVQGGESVRTISSDAFCQCLLLEEVELGQNVETIGSRAFSECAVLEKVEFGQNVETIESWAFFKCENLKTIPPLTKLNRIETGAFAKSGIEEIHIPDTLPEVGKSILSNTPYLEKQEGSYVMFGDAIAAYKGKGNITHVPNNAKIIPQRCFRNNEGLDEVYIPEGVEIIRGNIFDDIQHHIKIYIPQSVSQIAVPYEEDDDDFFADDESKPYLTIITTPDSYAHKYAVEHGYNYKLVDDVQALYESTLNQE